LTIAHHRLFFFKVRLMGLLLFKLVMMVLMKMQETLVLTIILRLHLLLGHLRAAPQMPRT